jgi:hypothetical protein
VKETKASNCDALVLNRKEENVGLKKKEGNNLIAGSRGVFLEAEIFFSGSRN